MAGKPFNLTYNNQKTQHYIKSRISYRLSARGYNWATLFLGDINTGTWPSRLGES
jgi:hypothetical protein